MKAINITSKYFLFFTICSIKKKKKKLIQSNIHYEKLYSFLFMFKIRTHFYFLICRYKYIYFVKIYDHIVKETKT